MKMFEMVLYLRLSGLSGRWPRQLENHSFSGGVSPGFIYWSANFTRHC